MPSQKVQDFLAQRARNSNIPELPMTRLRLNGNTGQFLVSVPDEQNEGKYKNIPMANPDGSPVLDSFGGVILKVMFFAEKKTKWEERDGKRFCTSEIKRITREFDQWRGEPIDVLDISKGFPGTHWKTFPDYPSFKSATTLCEEGETKGTWGYTLKAQVYLLQLSTQTIFKFSVSGKSLSELFSYGSRKKSDEALTIPWLVKFKDAVDVSQIKTVFQKHANLNQTTKAESFYVSFDANAQCSEDDMEIVVEKAMKLQEWMDAWKALRGSKPEEKVVSQDSVSEEGVPVIDAMEDMGMLDSSAEIPMDKIPF